jgi:hypothetical protein
MQVDKTTNQKSSHEHRVLLRSLTMSLGRFSQRFLPLADTARDVAVLVVRAEELAAEAWKLSASRIPDPARADALKDAFRAFIAEATELSIRAAQVAGVVRTVGDAIATQIPVLTKFADSEKVDDIDALRTQLRPLLATLEQLPGSLTASSNLAQDVVSMGANAARLSSQALAAQDHRIPAVEKVLALYRSLRDIATEAGTVAQTLLADVKRLRDGITGIATSTAQIVTTENGVMDATARLSQVISAGVARAPPSAIDWGVGGRG